MGNPDQAFRYRVVPLAMLLMLAGIVFPIAAWVARVRITSPFPFVESEATSRNLVGLWGLVCVAMSVGLLLRMRCAWYSLVLLLAAAPVIHGMGAFDPRVTAQQGSLFPVASAVISSLIGLGLYRFLKPAFAVRSDNGCESKE